MASAAVLQGVPRVCSSVRIHPPRESFLLLKASFLLIYHEVSHGYGILVVSVKLLALVQSQHNVAVLILHYF